jgi:glycosyltransferase involved in cell wall biosynthesis
MRVEIVCATFNGVSFVRDFLRSVEGQSHADWRLWIRDDGSSDETVEIVRERCTRDRRVKLLSVANANDGLGAARSFAWLLERLPDDAGDVMFADQDDVWRPDKIARTLTAMRVAESKFGERVPLLVHTDLTVTDAALRELHPSFWTYSRIRPEPVSLRRVIGHNVATGSTIMMNRALVRRVGVPPADVAMHDWWCVCVAAAFGHVVALHESTILYRQHTTNAVGARDKQLTLRRLPGAILARRNTTAAFRRDLDTTARQAHEFLARYGSDLCDADRRFLAAYARIPTRAFVRRKIDLLRFRIHPDHGMLHALGVLLRG